MKIKFSDLRKQILDAEKTGYEEKLLKLLKLYKLKLVESGDEIMTEYDFWVVEYSPVQKSWHVDKIGKTIEANILIINEKRTPEFFVVGIANSLDTALRLKDYMEKEVIVL